MRRFISSGHRAVNAESIRDAAVLISEIKSRRHFGALGHVGAFSVNSWSQDGSVLECTAFIGKLDGRVTTGHNVNFTVHAV